METKSWRERLNKEFFAGIPIEEMGSNQVDEAKLQAFIGEVEREAVIRGKVEALEWVKETFKKYDAWVISSSETLPEKPLDREV